MRKIWCRLWITTFLSRKWITPVFLEYFRVLIKCVTVNVHRNHTVTSVWFISLHVWWEKAVSLAMPIWIDHIVLTDILWPLEVGRRVRETDICRELVMLVIRNYRNLRMISLKNLILSKSVARQLLFRCGSGRQKHGEAVREREQRRLGQKPAVKLRTHE